MKNLTNSYVVTARGGLQNGRVKRTDGRYRVGANNPKEAVEFCKQQLDKTRGYSVFYKEIGRTLPRGMVVDDSPTPDPLVEIDGEIYIKTRETRYRHVFDNDFNENVLLIEQKFVNRYAKNERDVRWLTAYTITGEKQINRYLNEHPNP